MRNIRVYMRSGSDPTKAEVSLFENAGYWIKDGMLFITMADRGTEVLTPLANVLWVKVDDMEHVDDIAEDLYEEDNTSQGEAN